MKINTACSILIACIMSLCIAGCDVSGGQNSEDQAPVTITADLSGTLTMKYARDFPSLNASVTIDVYVCKTGEVLLSQPDQATYDATGEEPEQMKIQDRGSITVTSLSGRLVELGGEIYVQINANTLITGELTVWGWIDDPAPGYWHQLEGTPLSYDVEDPVESPMNFPYPDITMDPVSIGKTIPAYGGTQTFTWTLGLLPL